MVLKHDLIGRVLKKGMDYDGAIAAYRKAIALDPKRELQRVGADRDRRRPAVVY